VTISTFGTAAIIDTAVSKPNRDVERYVSCDVGAVAARADADGGEWRAVFRATVAGDDEATAAVGDDDAADASASTGATCAVGGVENRHGEVPDAVVDVGEFARVAFVDDSRSSRSGVAVKRAPSIDVNVSLMPTPPMTLLR
jgi:hypothetical protein